MDKAARHQAELRRVQDRIGRLFNSVAVLREGIALQEQVALEGRIHASLGGTAGVAKVTKAMSDMFLTIAGDATWATKVVKRQYDRLETQIGATYGYLDGDNTKATAKGLGLVSNYTKGHDKLWSGVAGKSTSAVANLKKGEYLIAGGDALEGVSKLVEDSGLPRGSKALKYAGTFIKSSKEAYNGLSETASMVREYEAIGNRSEGAVRNFARQIASKLSEIDRLREEERELQDRVRRAMDTTICDDDGGDEDDSVPILLGGRRRPRDSRVRDILLADIVQRRRPVVVDPAPNPNPSGFELNPRPSPARPQPGQTPVASLPDDYRDETVDTGSNCGHGSYTTLVRQPAGGGFRTSSQGTESWPGGC
jgi:hypothetical protein